MLKMSIMLHMTDSRFCQSFVSDMASQLVKDTFNAAIIGGGAAFIRLGSQQDSGKHVFSSAQEHGKNHVFTDFSPQLSINFRLNYPSLDNAMCLVGTAIVNGSILAGCKK